MRSIVLILVCASAWHSCSGAEWIGLGRHAREAGADDPSGRSVKTPRIRVVHSRETGPAAEGSSGWLIARDPFLAYARGREMFLRDFTEREGVFGGSLDTPQPILEDGRTRMIAGARSASCVLCHNTPFRDGGSGPTIAKNGASGRNTTHLFGAGQIEMIGAEIRRQLLAQADANKDGFISKTEAAGRSATVQSGTGTTVDLGYFDDRNGDGLPDLNPVCYVWLVNAEGRRVPRARDLNDPQVAGYSFEVQVFGWGHAVPLAGGLRTPVSSTLRGFSAAAFHVHAGLQAADPTLNEEPARNGLTGVSLCGAQQFFTARTLDRTMQRDARGVSTDDPDRDGILEELTDGDLDLIEFYQLHHPAPAEQHRTVQRQRGRELLDQIGCTSCHVPDWTLPARDAALGATGDRRLFDIPVRWNALTQRLEGRVVSLADEPELGVRRPRGGALTVHGVYSDFAYHDLGERFHQLQFNGGTVRFFKTAPLWGVGSSAPYGHDGASLDLDAVIRRHGGEAATSSAAYAKLDDAAREALLAFLRGLVLYATDELPCDINGDGMIASQFLVAARNTGEERFNPEWLFRRPGRVRGGTPFSFALENTAEAYGFDLKLLRDEDGDGFPDERFK